MERQHKKNRDEVILKTLQEELVGPANLEKLDTIDINQEISLPYKEIFKPRLQQNNNEEIICS